MKAVIVGAGAYGRVYLAYLREQAAFEILGFLDDDPAKLGTNVEDLPVLGATSDWGKIRDRGVEAVFAPIGDNRSRVRILQEAAREGFGVPGYMHPSVIAHQGTRQGSGVYVLPGTIVMPHVTIEDFVMISMGVKVAHHTTLRRGVFLSTGVNLGAGVLVEECAFLGIGCTVMTGVKRIGAGAIVGAGAVVIQDVEHGETVAGVPAKPKEKKARESG